MRLSVPIFSQNDPKWKQKKLGFSEVTIGGYGCLVAIIAMLAKYYGKDTDPEKLNDQLKNVNGYANQNLYKWYEGISKIYPDVICSKIVYTPQPVTTDQWNEMRRELDAGRPVVLQVDFIPTTSKADMHFVLLIGYENDQWIIADPWYGDTASLARYGKPEITVQQYVFHQGPVPQTAVDPLQECLKQHAQLVGKLDSIDSFRKNISKILVGIDEADWQHIYDEISDLIKEADDNRKLADLSLRLWNAIQTKTEQTFIYPAQEQELLAAFSNTIGVLTDDKHIITKEEYEKLKAKPIDKSGIELIVMGIAKLFGKSGGETHG